jgi:CitMHS family citrate-Mg2+:H+ or citrate-Ca2+:H+ symporter
MSLTILAFSMVVVFMSLIMTRRLSAITALILVPTVFGVLGGFGAEMGPMMLDGIVSITPTAVTLMFAILYFGIMIDAGLFDPLVKKIVQVVGGDPVKVVIGTAVLTLVVALDGDGATTYMVTVAAMLPLYARLGMNTLIMACIVMMSTSVMNVLPWGGPAGRVASALGVEMGDLFIPMIPAMLGSGLGVMLIAYRLGVIERHRLGTRVDARAALDDRAAFAGFAEGVPAEIGDRRPRLLWLNLVLTILLMTALLAAILPLAVLFMIAFAIAMMINYPSLDDQKERITAHAGNALAVSGLIFAAGIFTGILAGTGMVNAMANAVVSIVPTSLGPYMAVVAGLLSIPGTFFISYDAFYFGVMPVIAKAGAAYGIEAAEIARASLIGAPVHALSPLTASTYLLIGLSKIELGDHQRFSLKWTLIVSLLMLALLMVTGAVPITSGR